MDNRVNTTEASWVPQKTTKCENNSDSSNVERWGIWNGTIGFGSMCFVIKMSELVTHVSTWKFKSNDGMTPRYLTWCFTSFFKIEEKALVLSENFKTLMHYGFL